MPSVAEDGGDKKTENSSSDPNPAKPDQINEYQGERSQAQRCANQVDFFVQESFCTRKIILEAETRHGKP
ncbi:MAG: hypothetical protein J0H72_16605 [Burkholderiales bacterium]|nr:hypothetical protein [Burkholderiales bacterium]